MMMIKFMNFRSFSLGAIALALFVASASALAAKEADKARHDGKVVSIAGNKLVMADTQGKKEHTCTLTADAKVTCDGKVCKSSDLKPGMRIRVTTSGADKSVACRIEGIDKNRAFASNRHEGKLVGITGDKLVMTNKEGEEHSHTLCANVKLTLDGKACKAADLKPGTKICVTTPDADNSVANRIEGIEKNPAFASNCHDGKVVSITDDKLVMTDTQGKNEQTCAMTSDVKVTCDGKVCKSSDLKPGMRIRVTSENDDPQTANRIEGIDKNPAFANNSHDGKIVSITGDKLVMTNAQGEEERTCTLTADVKVTCDGKVCESSDLESGMRIRVTLNSDEPQGATKVEAIDKNPEFASLYTDLR